MARRTNGGVRKLKDGQGNYAYGLGLREGALVETMFGFQVVDGEDMPAFTTSTTRSHRLRRLRRGYTIVDRLGVSVIRDNITPRAS
jgi:HK97 family phage major capsid protein